ncbi:MAG: hypothetical protein H7A34_01820 [bacterium]|nr:hypothetical protein [bacterium]
MKYKVKGEIYILLKEIVEGLQKGNFNSDPFGYCTQLFFLLENRLETNHLDALSDWMNSFIHEVLIEGKISRSADNEITSAILGSYILQKHERLTVEVDYKKVNELLKQHCDDKGYYFRKNLTYTICLALGLFDHKANIDCWETTRKSLQEEYKNGNLQCDSKNLCYYTLLMEKEDNKKILEEIAKSTVDILIKNAPIPMIRHIYGFAWHNKRFIKRN